MVLLVTFLVLHGVGLIGSMPGGPGIPENITVTFLSPSSVKISWAISMENVDKYDVTYKPTDARVVEVVAGNSDAVTLSGLKADTQYQLTVAAVWGGKKYRSRPIVFRTLGPSRITTKQDVSMAFLTSWPPQQIEDSSSFPPIDPDEFSNSNTTVRGVEIGIVLLVLLVWVAAIALFFNRWGKIRMLLPYQPDYKEQLKVPGSAACAAAVAAGNACIHHSGDHMCSQVLQDEGVQISGILVAIKQDHSADFKRCNKPRQKFRWSSNFVDGEASGTSGEQRPRINSAIFTSNSGPGFDSVEFFRRHGSQSKLCRKAHSVDNISDEDHNHFGLPMLSISGPSPPDDAANYVEETDDCM